jgi:nitrate/nitrite transporter NarK
LELIDMRASNTVLGLVVGLVLGLAAAFGGFGAFLLVLVLGVVGLLVGRYLDGQLDLDGLTGRGRSGDRPSTRV